MREASLPRRARVGRRGTEPRNRQPCWIRPWSHVSQMGDWRIQANHLVQQMEKLSFGAGRFCSKSHRGSIGPPWRRADIFPVLFILPTFIWAQGRNYGGYWRAPTLSAQRFGRPITMQGSILPFRTGEGDLCSVEGMLDAVNASCKTWRLLRLPVLLSGVMTIILRLWAQLSIMIS